MRVPLRLFSKVSQTYRPAGAAIGRVENRGATDEELMAIFGWRQNRRTTHTKKARRKKIVVGAIRKLLRDSGEGSYLRRVEAIASWLLCMLDDGLGVMGGVESFAHEKRGKDDSEHGAKPNGTDKRRVGHDRRAAKRAEQCSQDEIGEKRGCLFFSGP